MFLSRFIEKKMLSCTENISNSGRRIAMALSAHIHDPRGIRMILKAAI